MSGGVALLPNPDGCTVFEPNAFKKEKCKHCGRPWTEHAGVIAEPLLQGFLAAANKAAAHKQKAEDEAAQKARGKALQKKASQQAVEDAWYNDKAKDGGSREQEAEDDEDEDGGFRMFTPAAEERKPQQSPDAFKPLKVVNLIDFGECDVVEEPAGNEAAGASLDPEWTPRQPGADSAADGAAAPAVGAHGEPGSEGEPPDLLAEIQHLRQMLADANEEKAIQVAIIQDEVTEKQRLIDDLAKRRAESEAALRAATEQLEELQSRGTVGSASGEDGAPPRTDDVEHWRAEAARWRAEAEAAAGLRSRVAQLEQELECAKATAAMAEAKAAVAQADAKQARASAAAAIVLPQSPPAFGESKQAEAHVLAQEMGRQATQALREIRLSAEQQLAWLSNRMSVLEMEPKPIM